jgi:hypothetical protein
VAGINLTDAELTRIAAQGGITFGDAAQTGDITFVTAAISATAVTALQNPTGGGKIVLDDQNGIAAALADGTGYVTLLAGLGGILAASPSNITPEIAATGIVLLDTNGPVGSLTNRIQFAAGTPSQIAVGTAFAPSGVFISGLNSLNLGNILVSNTGTIDVTARTDINVAPNSTITAGTISLAADTREDGPVRAASSTIQLGGDFTTRAGEFPDGPTDLLFASSTGTGVQHLDTGGQTFHNISLNGGVPLQLVNNPLNLTGTLNATASPFDLNGQAVTVAGLTTDDVNLLPDSAPESFLGGLLVNGNFQGGSGPVTAGGVTIGRPPSSSPRARRSSTPAISPIRAASSTPTGAPSSSPGSTSESTARTSSTT